MWVKYEYFYQNYGSKTMSVDGNLDNIFLPGKSTWILYTVHKYAVKYFLKLKIKSIKYSHWKYEG